MIYIFVSLLSSLKKMWAFALLSWINLYSLIDFSVGSYSSGAQQKKTDHQVQQLILPMANITTQKCFLLD